MNKFSQGSFTFNFQSVYTNFYEALFVRDQFDDQTLILTTMTWGLFFLVLPNLNEYSNFRQPDQVSLTG